MSIFIELHYTDEYVKEAKKETGCSSLQELEEWSMRELRTMLLEDKPDGLTVVVYNTEPLLRPDVIEAVAEMLGDYCPMYNLLGRKVLAQNVIRTAVEAARKGQGE